MDNLNFESVVAFVTKYIDVKPSTYADMFVPKGTDIDALDHLASQGQLPTVAMLSISVGFAVFLSILRLLLQHILFTPFARKAMKIKYHEVTKNSVLDAAFKRNNKPSATIVKELATQTGMEVAAVNSEFTKRLHNSSNDKRITKFIEAAWRCIFYTSFVIIGYYTLFEPTAIWIQVTIEYFRGWPLHPVTTAMHFYYLVELGAYLHQLAWTEVTRSDATEMIVHHIVTILLITISYLTNFVRVGTVVLFLHDISDILLESAKCVNYASKAKGHEYLRIVTDSLFGMFAITFFITRLFFYPRIVLYPTLFESVLEFGRNWAGYYVFNGLLLALQALHIFWFYLISRMIYKLVVNGGVEKDERSDDDEPVEEPEHDKDQ